MTDLVRETHVEGLPLIHRGKVRETYAVGDDRLLLVATDRLSAFDVVFDQPIPDKGRLLTQLSACWFGRLASLGPTHFLSTDAADLPPPARTAELAGRTTLARRAERVDAECVVRGYLAGSGWAEYRRSGAVCGHVLPPRLKEAGQLPEPIFTPSTKAEEGHDENITRGQLADLVGRRARPAAARSARSRSTAPAPRSPSAPVSSSPTRSSSSAGSTASSRSSTRCCTPDSSRFWDADLYAPGQLAAQLRQAVRARLRGGARGWNKEPPAPTLPDDVDRGHARALRDRLRAPHRGAVGRRGAIGLVRWLAEVQVTLRPGIADPEGATIAGGLRSLGYDSVSDVRAGKQLRITFRGGGLRRGRGGGGGDVPAPARQPGDGGRRPGRCAPTSRSTSTSR